MIKFLISTLSSERGKQTYENQAATFFKFRFDLKFKI